MKKASKAARVRTTERGPKRNDGTLDTTLGDSNGFAGSGADLASQDMEIPNPSPS